VNSSLKAVDDDFAQAVRLEASAEKASAGKLGVKESRIVTRFPFVRMPNLDIRMIPKKLLVVKGKEHFQNPSEDLRNQVLASLVSTDSASLMLSPKLSDSSLSVITSKVAIHRFAVVRIRIRRRIVGALDLIVRRGAFPFPEDEPKKLGERSKPQVKNPKLDSETPKILLHDPAPANSKSWILPGIHS
jgi:hypothetical protein